jgi:hypothetical protein
MSDAKWQGRVADSGVCPNATPRLDNTVTSNRLVPILFKTDPENNSQNKVVLSGHFIESYEYEKPLVLNKRPSKKVKRVSQLPEYEQFFAKVARSLEYRQRTKHRVIGVVQRLVESNFDKDSIFITLTFNDKNNFNISDLSICNKKFHNFIVKLRILFGNIKYLAVPEFQDKNNRGAVHYHLIVNRPYIHKKVIRKFWKFGFIKIKDIYYLQGIGNYFTKYLTKNSDDERLAGKRSFFTSRNLRRSKTVYCELADRFIDGLAKNNVAPYFVNKYKSEFNGTVIYKKYHIDTKISI